MFYSLRVGLDWWNESARCYPHDDRAENLKQNAKLISDSLLCNTMRFLSFCEKFIHVNTLLNRLRGCNLAGDASAQPLWIGNPSLK